MYIMCLIISEEKADVQDQYPLSLNPVQKADDPIQNRNRSIGPLLYNIQKVILIISSLLYEFKRVHFWAPFLKA